MYNHTMATVLFVIFIIILIPIFCDIAIKESHICKSILESIPLYRKLVAFIDSHSTFFGWLLFFFILFIIYPLCFNWGYNSYKPITFGYIIPPISKNNHPNPAYIAYELKNQIYNNDSLFVVKCSSTDSIVFNRKSLKLEKQSSSIFSLSDYDDRYENTNKFEKMILGALVVPSWKEIKGNLSLSSNGKKGWIICCMIAGYFGYHQGVKCKKTEINYSDFKEWNRIFNLLNNEHWWLKVASAYPYQQDEYIVVEDHPYGYGVGIGFNVENNSIIVNSVTDNSPAQVAGIIPGDKIVSIDNSDFTEVTDTITYVWTHMRGKKGTSVKLEIQRDSNYTKTFILDRKPFGLPLRILIDEPIIIFE